MADLDTCLRAYPKRITAGADLTILNIKAIYEAPRLLSDQAPSCFTDVALYLMNAIMSWPRDGVRQKQYLQICCAPYQPLYLKILLENPSIPQDSIFATCFRALHSLVGDINEILDLPSKSLIDNELQQNRLRGRNAGMALFSLYCLNASHKHQITKNISLTNVWHWLESNGQTLFGLSLKKDQLDADWEDFKNVAHLWAADVVYDLIYKNRPIDGVMTQFFTAQKQDKISPELINLAHVVDMVDHKYKYIFSYANLFQYFGLSYKSKHSKKCLLDSDDLYLVDEIPDWNIELAQVLFADPLVKSFGNPT